jgi:hypothetical protein
MQGHWKIFILFKQKEGKRYIYIKGAPTKLFSLVGKNCISEKNSRVLRISTSKVRVNVHTFSKKDVAIKYLKMRPQ